MHMFIVKYTLLNLMKTFCGFNSKSTVCTINKLLGVAMLMCLIENSQGLSSTGSWCSTPSEMEPALKFTLQ